MTDKSATGRKSRRRGAEFEREIAERFKALGYPDARRNLQPQGGRIVGNDLTHVPFAVECKRTDACLIPKGYKAWDQCDEDARAIGCHKPRVVITRWNDQTEPFVVMRLADLEALLPPEDKDFEYGADKW